MIDSILGFNREFVEKRKKDDQCKEISGHARKEVMIFTCMDTRLVGLVEEAMGFRRGEVKVLKNAGNTIREGCDDVIRCVSLGALMMGIREVYVVGHKDCGMRKVSPQEIKQAMRERGIPQQAIDRIDVKKWAGIIEDEKENVVHVVNKLKNSEYIPKDIVVHGLLIDPYSGELEVVI